MFAELGTGDALACVCACEDEEEEGPVNSDRLEFLLLGRPGLLDLDWADISNSSATDGTSAG